MTAEPGKPDLHDVPDQALESELEQRIEKRAEEWGRNLEQKIDRLESRIPPPVSALLDVVCVGLLVLGACWLMARFGWISMPSRRAFLIVAVAIYVVSLGVRLRRKAPRGS